MNAGQIGPFPAFGKINWSLLITGIRPDGYHLLDTVMQKITLCDEITLTPAAEWGVACDNPQIPQNGENTALAAALAYAQATGIADVYTIRITKRIPSGAGLGGGSADAAAVLNALNERYAALSQEDLLALAVGVGADVPFCLSGGCARCTGVGELMEHSAQPREYHLVVASAGVNLSTPAVFRRYDGLAAAEGGRRSTDVPLMGKMSDQNGQAPFLWQQDAAKEAPFEEVPESAPEPAQAPPPTGDGLTADLMAALATGEAEKVAEALSAFSGRLRGDDPARAVAVCGVPCDVRFASEANCMLCVAGGNSVMCGANDLTAAACDLTSGVSYALSALQRAGALAVSMSGSGSACFGLFASREEAERAAEKLVGMPFCAVCSTIE